MNTCLKKTPLPDPSLSLFTKNFSDGNHETDTNSTIVPTFQSLGAPSALQTGPDDQLAVKIRLNENQQRKVRLLFIYL